MEGLEATVRSLSQVRDEHLFFRIDSEHYQKVFLTNLSRIRDWKAGWVKLGDALADMTGGATPLGADYPETGVRFLRVQNVMLNYIDDADMAFISAADDSELARSRLQTNDVLLTITGVSYGKSAIVTAEFAGSNINQHSVRMQLKHGRIRPFFLSTFLNAAPGKLQSDQNVTGGTRPALDYSTIKHFSVPLCSGTFQSHIEATVRAAHAQLESAKAELVSAEQTLIDALGLLDWQPPEPMTYERKAKEAFKAGRLDAEYYRPRYDDLFEILRKQGDFCLGDRLVEPIRRGISPEYVEEGGDVLVINSKHVGKVQVELEDNRRTTRKLLKNQVKGRGEVRVGDVLLNSTGYITIGRCQCLLENVAAVVDNHVAIIRPAEGLDPVYLACFLNTLPGQMQSERGWTGSSGQIELRPDVIADYRIWNAPSTIQKKIRSLVEQAHATRREAKQSLDRAKRAVEIAIEEGEAAGMAFLKSEGGGA